MKSIKGFGGQYLNEIIGLVVMALMAVALVAAQAQALAPAGDGSKDDRHASEVRIIVSGQDGHDWNEGY